MAARSFVAQPLSASSSPLTATGNSPIFWNNSGLNSIDVEIDVTAAPSGTSPTLTVQLQASLDGGATWENVGAATASITTAGRTLLTNNNVDESALRLAYTLGGTSPSFPVEISVFAF